MKRNGQLFLAIGLLLMLIALIIVFSEHVEPVKAAAVTHSYQRPPVPEAVSNLITPADKPEPRRVTVADIRRMRMDQSCGFTAEEIESVLRYNLVGMGQQFFAAQAHGVNGLLLVAIAALESGWGRHPMGHNIMGVYRYHPASYVQCIDHTAGLLASEYLAPGGQWYHGLTVEAINQEYCRNAADVAPNMAWSTQVEGLMVQFYNQIYGEEQDIKRALLNERPDKKKVLCRILLP